MKLKRLQHSPQRCLLFARPKTARRGFTLVEICVAMAIAVLILGIATLSMAGVQGEAQLKKMAARVEGLARESLLQAVMNQRVVQLSLGDSLGAEGDLQIRRLGSHTFRKLHLGEVWEFSPSGVCEPIEIRITNSAGEIELGFDPLTGCAIKKEVRVDS